VVSGSVRRRQQRIGEFDSERLDDDAMREHLVEGVNDTESRRPAQRSRTTQQSGTRRRNIHDPSAEMNVPNLRYFNISNAFQHLSGLTDAVAQAFVNPPPPPPRTVTDVMNDFARSSEQLHIAETRNFAVGIEFWNNVLRNLVAEHTNMLSSHHSAIGSGNVHSTTEQNGNNE
jgi:hypothetical protein